MCKQRDRCRVWASCRGWGLHEVAMTFPRPPGPSLPVAHPPTSAMAQPRLLVSPPGSCEPHPCSPPKPAWSTCVPARAEDTSALPTAPPNKKALSEMRAIWRSRSPPHQTPARGGPVPEWASSRSGVLHTGPGSSGLCQSAGCCDQGWHLWRGHCWPALCLWPAALGAEGYLDPLLDTTSLCASPVATLTQRASGLF